MQLVVFWAAVEYPLYQVAGFRFLKADDGARPGCMITLAFVWLKIGSRRLL